MASKKQTQKKTGSARNVTRGGKTKARKGTAPKTARAKKPDPKRSAAGKAGAAARWGKGRKKRPVADENGPE